MAQDKDGVTRRKSQRWEIFPAAFPAWKSNDSIAELKAVIDPPRALFTSRADSGRDSDLKYSTAKSHNTGNGNERNLTSLKSYSK